MPVSLDDFEAVEAPSKTNWWEAYESIPSVDLDAAQQFNPTPKVTQPSPELASKLASMEKDIPQPKAKSAADILNIPFEYGGKLIRSAYNFPAQITHAYEPLGENESLTPTVVSDAAKTAAETLFQPKNMVGMPTGNTPLSQAAGAVAEKTAKSLGMPDMLASIPFFESKVVRGVMLGAQALQIPEQVQKISDTFNNPKSTAEQKWEALGDAGVNLAMSTALALSLKGPKVTAKDVQAKYSPEDAGKILDANGKPTTVELPETEAPQPKEERAIQKQGSDQSVLRAAQTGVELPPVGEGDAQKETPPVARPQEEKVSPLTPVIRFTDDDGNVRYVTGEDHGQAVVQAAAEGHSQGLKDETHERGFLYKGKFLTRAEAAKVFEDVHGLEPDKPGELHSQDLSNNGFKVDLKAPAPDWKVAVTSPHGEHPGHVQIVDKAKGTEAPPTVESLRAAGHDVPDFSKLPQGNYTWEQAVNKLAEQEKAAASKPQPAAKAATPEPEMVGMGGATPSEFDKSQQTPTGIKNATVDAERAKRGLPPAMQPARRSFGEVWDRAMAMIDRDPSVVDNLLNELRDKPRALTDVEDALLLHRQIDLQNEYGKATRDLAQAFDDGRHDAVEQEKLRVAQLSDQLLDTYNIGKRAGTETGRGLNARKMMAYEDFTLAKMELEKRAANGGRPLSDAERAEMTALHNKINELQKAYDEHRAATEDRIRQLETDKALAEAKAQAAKPEFHPKIIDAAKKIVGKLDQRADAARKRLREKFSRTSMAAGAVDPTILLDLADIGASHLGHGIVNFAEWSVKMAQDLGDLADKFKDNMAEIFAASEEHLDKATADNPLDVARAMRRKPPEEQIKANAEKIGEKVKAGKKEDITWYVQRIARLLVQSGVTEREQLIDRIHGILQQSMPDITRRQAMDAISGYGDFKQLSKDAISVQLRGMKGEMQQLAKLEDMAKGQPPLKSGVERRTPTEAERQLVKRVNEAKFKFQVPMSDPSTQLKSALDTLKTTLRNRIADYEDKIARGDYSRAPRRELVLDNEAMRLKAEAERVKQKWQQGLNRDRYKQRTPWEKTMDAVVKWRRGFILSGPVTLAKLTSAALARAIITPAEEAAGSLIGKIIPSVSEKAPREGGGFNVRAEAKAIAEGLTTGMKDAWKTLTTGKSDLDVTYGKNPGLPQSFMDIFGNIHGALKAPVKRAEFARALEKRLSFYASKGVDITDEFVQTKAGVEAYQDAQRSIFMQKNIINDAYKRALSRFDQVNKATGKPSMAGKAAGTTARVLLPIVKVPTNIVAETMQYAIGSITGSARLAKAFHDGISKLSPEDADLIMRHLKKGSLGGAVMLAGYLAPQMLGGFYQQGERRKKSDIKPDSARIEGVNIPSYYIHNPWISAAQIGATIRRVGDSKLRKRDKNTQGLSHGAMAAAVGLADATPFVREMTEISKLMNPYERDQWVAEMAKSMVVPQGVQSLANWLDKNDKGETVRRNPTTITEGIKSGIPGLRQTVPKKAVR